MCIYTYIYGHTYIKAFLQHTSPLVYVASQTLLFSPKRKEALTPPPSFTPAAPFTSLPWPLLFHFFLRSFPYIFHNKLKLSSQRSPAVPHDKWLSLLSRTSLRPVVIVFSLLFFVCIYLASFLQLMKRTASLVAESRLLLWECTVYLNVQYSQRSSDVELFFFIYPDYLKKWYCVVFWQTNAIK